MDALTTSNHENALLLEKKSEETSTKDSDKMNRVVCGVIKSCLTQDIKYGIITDTLTKKI